MNHIVIDLEFNQSAKRGQSVPECPFEIIQIGAVKLDDNLKKTGEFTFLIKPKIYEKINPIVERLTGITDEILNDSPCFEEAYDAFVKFVGDEDSVLYTWGVDDVKFLFKNIKFFGCDTKLITKKYINIQPFAAKAANSLSSGGTIGLKNAAEFFGIDINLKFHDALNDADYTAKILKIVFKDLPEPSIFSTSETSARTKIQTKIDIKELINYFENSLDRKLTKEEKAIALTAYKLGIKKKYNIKLQ